MSGGLSDPGGGSLYRWDGNAFTRHSDAPIDARATAIWAFAPDNAWMAWSDASLLHFDGAAWSAIALDGAPTISALWGDAPDDLWAGGSGGMIMHFDGTCWRNTPSPRNGTVVSLSGSGPDDVWAVDQNGGVLHWNGQAWYAWKRSSLSSSPARVVVLAKNEIWGRPQSRRGWRKSAATLAVGWAPRGLAARAGRARAVPDIKPLTPPRTSSRRAAGVRATVRPWLRPA